MLKTAYEMRISDLSSDVCSSDLLLLAILAAGIVEGQIARGDRGITPINSSGDFLASGIKVDVTGDNAGAAREKGWREAQRMGWAQLYRKTNGRPEARRVGKECVRMCRSGWRPSQEKKTKK